jgi:hypothetical protein
MPTFEKAMEDINKLPDKINTKKGILYSKANYWKDNWNKDYYLRYAIETGKPYQKIIAKFLQLKETELENYEQAGFFFQRNEKVASQMIGFSLDKISKVYKYLESKMGSYRIALETVGKYLEENIESLDGTPPIIILKDGEKIYDIKRLQQLERERRIYWKNDKWNEF